MGDINRPGVDVDADTLIHQDQPTLTPAPPIDEVAVFGALDVPTLPPGVDPDPKVSVSSPDADTLIYSGRDQAEAADADTVVPSHIGQSRQLIRGALGGGFKTLADWPADIAAAKMVYDAFGDSGFVDGGVAQEFPDLEARKKEA